jgi:hypothetical protein
MTKKILFACAALVFVLALSIPAVVQGQGDLPQRAGLQPFVGDGWWFYYPEQATLEQLSLTEFSVIGPMIQYRHTEYDALFEGPAYRLDISVYENPNRVFPEVWAQETILEEWRTIQAQGGPNTLPVAADGLSLDPTKVQSLIINHYPAFKVEFFGGDGPVWRVYVGTGDTIVVFHYRGGIPQNDPITALKDDLYTLMINTVEFAE